MTILPNILRTGVILAVCAMACNSGDETSSESAGDGGSCGLCGPNSADVLGRQVGLSGGGDPVLKVDYMKESSCPQACGGEPEDTAWLRWDGAVKEVVIEPPGEGFDLTKAELTSSEGDTYSATWTGSSVTGELIQSKSNKVKITFFDGEDSGEATCTIEANALVCS
ncbi:MAG: hypothetical protein ACPG4T_19130 [Nannocystaceae bacterium]